MSFKITQQAARQIIQSAQEEGMQNLALRVAAKRKVDGAIEYALGFDAPAGIDNISHQFEVQILIAPTSIDLLAGSVLDFAVPENETDPQFIFLNPNDPAFVPPGTD
ncbi:MAG: iron-sulfur cluster assembly accessory protein [Acidiferrobacteraceae bacterium]|jgi:iron-sulfur cluster assembly protein|nr:iron-sulfur cluster assembly accessory protein [Acidiferrobacteraceae bacterium]MDP7563168.1 hypothetical protein [Arenicellales bacterium]